MKDIQQQIEEIVIAALPDESLFIVAIDTSLKGKRQYVKIKIDGDQGVTIDQCAEISRKVGRQFEELDLIENAYKLEVSSPGVDTPLQFPRQYPQHIGRELHLTLTDGKEFTAKLEGVHDEKLSLIPFKEGKRNQKHYEELTTIPIDSIKEAKVLISF